MKSIQLGSEVVVSDPCYEIPTWCQAIVRDVLPGNYRTTVLKSDEGDWGTRCSHVIAIHSDHCHQDSKFKWERFPAEIGVDSGQAGIFSMDSYRKDDHPFDTQGYDFGANWDSQDGDKWYRQMCGRTLGTEQWGLYDKGIVSSSGYGDGGYTLFVAMKNKKVVGFVIDFGLSDKPIKRIVNDEFLTRV